MITAIAEFFSNVLSYFYGIVPNFAIAIILLTLLVKLVTFPLNNKQIASAKKMKELQPEIKKIQQKYKNDKEKQNKEVMEFMRENKMNPLAGCLPLLVQFPIMIGVFQLLRAPADFIIPKIGADVFSPYLVPALEFVDLTITPTEAGAFAYYIFPVLSGITTFIYQKQSMGDSGQKMLLYLMPAMITFFSFQFPVGLVIYWVMNNLFSMGQHTLIVHMDKSKEVQSKPDEKGEGKNGKKGDKDKK